MGISKVSLELKCLKMLQSIKNVDKDRVFDYLCEIKTELQQTCSANISLKDIEEIIKNLLNCHPEYNKADTDTLKRWVSDWIDEQEQDMLKIRDVCKAGALSAITPGIPALIIDGRSGGQVSETLIDKDKLKELFVPAFQDKSYKTIDKSTESEKISRFDVFCSRLDMTLNDVRQTNKIVGEIAYLVYISKYTSPDYRRPSRSGQRGKFRQLLKQIAEAVNMDDFYLQPVKCSNPSDELKSTFDML